MKMHKKGLLKNPEYLGAVYIFLNIPNGSYLVIWNSINARKDQVNTATARP